MQIFKFIQNSGNFKPLLMLIACMCIFISASCIYAADVDDAIGNISYHDSYIDDLDDDRFAKHEVSNLDGDAGNSANPIDNVSDDIPHHKNSKDADGKKAKPHHRHHHKYSLKNFSDENVKPHHRHHHKYSANSFLGKNIKPHHKNVPDKNSQNTFINSNKILISCSVFGNHMFQSVKINSPVSGESKAVKDECCCFEHHPFNHRIHADMHSNDKSSVANENDNLAYSYSCNSQSTNSKAFEISHIVLQKDSNQINSNLKNVLSVDYCMDSCQNGENSIKDYGRNMSANDLSVNCTDCYFNSVGLKTNSDADELDICDYNLEYYMFTNPDIIIANANQTFTKTMTSTNSISNIETIFNQDPSTECITDNYGVTDYLLNNATFFETVSPIEADILDNNVPILSGHSLKNPEIKSVILILGEFKCLN